MAEAPFVAPYSKTQRLTDIVLALTVGIAVTFTVIVEWMARIVLEGTVDSRSLLLLALLAVPLLVLLGALAMSLVSRPRRLRWAGLLVILLVPPAIVFLGA